jgi:transcriptional regulator with XRE-family HTH domain
MSRGGQQFGNWLSATMRSRGMSQAAMARVVGVADAQVSRWRRGQVIPSVHYLQRIAETLSVPRNTLDLLAGYPVDDGSAEQTAVDPDAEAELQTYQAELRDTLEQKLPRELWKPYVEACEALAGELAASYERALNRAREPESPEPRRRSVGFQP